MVNNLAISLANTGYNVAILDATKNKSMYYIHTKNEELLRKLAYSSIENLSNGISNGIKVKDNLTIYTSVNSGKYINNVNVILDTLLKNHTIILIDCDITTPFNYFKYSQEIYIVQSMDILAIQDFVEFLGKLENEKALENEKTRVIINKYIKLNGISEKDVLSRLSFYNDPTLSYMREIFHKETVKYITISFYETVCKNYLEMTINGNINFNDYPIDLINAINNLSREICYKQQNIEE